MTTGTYSFNGTELLTQPSDGQWLPRKSLGDDGSGHPIYPALREFQLQWDIIDPPAFQQLQNFYNTVSNTGSIVANLPTYGLNDFVFFPYSGCTLEEPQVSTYFAKEGYLMKAKLVVRKIQI